jgi:hypothetical protein
MTAEQAIFCWNEIVPRVGNFKLKPEQVEREAPEYIREAKSE